MFREYALDVLITIAIEFARLANIYRVTSIKSLIAKHIKAIILANLILKD
jgi:hypothetical protein